MGIQATTRTNKSGRQIIRARAASARSPAIPSPSATGPSQVSPTKEKLSAKIFDTAFSRDAHVERAADFPNTGGQFDYFGQITRLHKKRQGLPLSFNRSPAMVPPSR